ncbi:MAG TPA: FG-GAP-like repeat-containing protein, partial [Lacipirellulaceae bacterium]|nr:FG-GAP-like repeat-containing protein [Lacipirellulaceae bacterium]
MGQRKLQIEPLEDRLLLAADFGDAPNPYPTLLVGNGARHEATGPRLGALVDAEPDGQPTAAANGDDTHGVDDEDGVTFGTLQVGQLSATVNVNVQNAPLGAKLDAWIDFNGDGVWDSAHEQIATSTVVHAGSNTVSFAVPSGISPGLKYARFRLSTAGGLSPAGPAADGEVEDSTVIVLSAVQAQGLYGHERVVIPQYNDATTVTAADIDGDGDVDLISGSRSGAILLRTNDGHGNFTTQTIATIAGPAWKVRTADIDGDGDLDIISAGDGTKGVTWYENLGAGVFQTHAVGTTTASNYDIWASDVDGDGDVDLIAG